MTIASDAKFDRPWECRLPAFRVLGGLWFVGNTSGASWLLETEVGPVLFDTNYPTLAPLLIDSIWSAGFDPRSLAAIFHTHGHYDHFGATDFLKNLSGATTYLSRLDAKMLCERPELSLSDWGKHIFPKPLIPDVMLSDGEIITIGGIPIRCAACPGHTPGAMSFFFPVIADGKTYTAGLHGGAGLNTLTGDFIKKYDVNWREDFLRGIEYMQKESVDVFLANHTKACHVAEKLARMGDGPNPFVDAEEWPEFLLSLYQDYEKLILNEQKENLP